MNDILFGNNNKAVIKKLANRSFRSNKMRNVIAVIAIALTTFLFTAVLTIGMGAKGTLEYNMAKMIGTGADALVQGLSEEQFQQLKENSMFEKVGCWVPIEIMTNTNRIFAEIDYADQPQLELRMQTPRTGSAPQKANEVLVSANILNDLNIEEKIGAEIPIEFKNRQSGQMYHFDMIVSGIYDTPNEKSESVIVSKAFMEENPEMMNEIAQGREGCGIYDADVIMRDSSMVKERISEFVRSIGGNPDDRSAENYVRVAPNTFLSNNSGGSIMWLVAGVFGVLFMFCGYLLIYNVFEIAVTNDIRQYGLLRTVGTTSQQIKRLVNRQALYLFLIGTPFGLLFGILLGRSILPAALQMFAADYSGKNIEVSTLPYLGIIVGAILFSGLTVYISTRKSVKKASHDWNAVLRHNDNNKWYGVVLEASADKLGLPEAGIIDVLNVKSDPLLIGSLRGQEGYFPAYHMNKEKWLSIQLGKPELDDAIKDLLSLSHELTAPKKRNPKSSAKNPGDSANGKEKEIDEG